MNYGKVYSNKERRWCNSSELRRTKVSKATYGSGYDYSYTITEPGEWIVDDEKLFDVEEGDVVLKMYSVTNNWEEKEYIKLHSPELNDYYRRRDEHNKRRELEKPCNDCVCCEKA